MLSEHWKGYLEPWRVSTLTQRDAGHLHFEIYFWHFLWHLCQQDLEASCLDPTDGMTANQVVKILVDSYLNSEHYMLALSSIHEINQIVSPQLPSSLLYVIYLETCHAWPPWVFSTRIDSDYLCLIHPVILLRPQHCDEIDANLTCRNCV